MVAKAIHDEGVAMRLLRSSEWLLKCCCAVAKVS